MKRLRSLIRWTFLSFAIFLPAVILTAAIRSCYVADDFAYILPEKFDTRPDPERLQVHYFITSSSGAISFSVRHISSDPEDYNDYIKRGIRARSLPGSYWNDYHPRLAGKLYVAVAGGLSHGVETDWAGNAFDSYDVIDPSYVRPPPPSPLWRIPESRFGHFTRNSWEFNFRGFISTWTVPYWSIFGASVLPLTFVLARSAFRYLKKRRLPPFHCAVCQYDLRAHAPGTRCPECGTPIPAIPATTT